MLYLPSLGTWSLWSLSGEFGQDAHSMVEMLSLLQYKVGYSPGRVWTMAKRPMQSITFSGNVRKQWSLSQPTCWLYSILEIDVTFLMSNFCSGDWKEPWIKSKRGDFDMFQKASKKAAIWWSQSTLECTTTIHHQRWATFPFFWTVVM